jgi:uncharacterized protein involved in cysteine biosynthesis
MITALFRAFLQLTDPPVARVIWISVVATMVGFLGLALGLSGILYVLHVTGIGWLDPIVDVLGGIAVLFLSYLVFPAVLPAISSLFLDDVASAVEKRHYPALQAPRSAPFSEILFGSVRFLFMTVLLNLLAIPFYLVPGMNIAIFFSLNGYLLGREYFEQVAERHLDLVTLTALRRRHRGRLFVAGVIICGLGMIPIINLLGPVVACAFMVHVFQKLPERA